MLHPQKDGANEKGESRVPFFHRRVCDRAERATDAGVEEGDIEAAPTVNRGIHETPDVLFHGDVAQLEGDPVGKSGLCRRFKRLARIGLIQVTEQNPRTLIQQAEDRSTADATGAAGDNRNTMLKSIGHQELPPDLR